MTAPSARPPRHESDVATPSYAANLADRLRVADDRVPLVERAFLGQRLGLGRDDLDLLDEDVIARFLALPSSVVLPIAAARLLDHLDAHAGRAHPVDLEFHGPITVVIVPVGDEDATRVVLEAGRVFAPDGVPTAGLPLDDAESLAYALLRLVKLGREETS